MALPWLSPAIYAKWHPARLAKWGLSATVILTLAMAFPIQDAWPLLRFAAGVASGITFLGTASWCMVRLSALGRPELAGLVFGGPGSGILITGLMTSVMVAAHWQSRSGWVAFSVLAALLCVFIWPVIRGPAALTLSTGAPKPTQAQAASMRAQPVPTRVLHALAYGLSGFGYIITATFLPVIARTVLPGNTGWADLFWPIAGAGALVGTLISTRLPVRWSRRWLLLVAYLIQAAGVALTLWMPTTIGFLVSSLLVGLPFTAISFFALQEARREWPASADSFAGLVTGTYSIGQIAGPPLVAWLLQHSADGRGFDRALECASLALVAGAVIYAISLWCWPEKAAGRN
ncbi:YbfB/YjiJ family MFS transporter [Diaphorobacter aerolatus]|uniref:YbfB/YjiJ family MFS transporter n=1 Tax=Diaphorobacter aerolatus TaxID=1288495 RepID=UPI00299F7133|nr:YbfB/YjiJ family MFS transporter [Diaphorobacter aerolatus]